MVLIPSKNSYNHNNDGIRNCWQWFLISAAKLIVVPPHLSYCNSLVVTLSWIPLIGELKSLRCCGMDVSLWAHMKVLWQASLQCFWQTLQYQWYEKSRKTVEIQHSDSSLPSCHSTPNDTSEMLKIVPKLPLNLSVRLSVIVCNFQTERVETFKAFMKCVCVFFSLKYIPQNF